MAALPLTAVGGTRGETSIALAADGLLAVVLGSKSLERGLNDTTTETEDKVKGRFLLDVVVAQSTAILELLTSKDKTLLVRGDALLVLDLCLDVVDGVARLDVEGNSLTRQGLHEDLHGCDSRGCWLTISLDGTSERRRLQFGDFSLSKGGRDMPVP